MSQYSVKAIIGRRTNKKDQRQYLIHWEGYNESDSTWEPLRNLKFVMEMVKQFDEKFEKQGGIKQSKPKNQSSKAKNLKHQDNESIQEKQQDKHTPKQISKEKTTKNAESNDAPKEVIRGKMPLSHPAQQRLCKNNSPPITKKQKMEIKKAAKEKIPPKNRKLSKIKFEPVSEVSDHAEQIDENLKVLGMHCDQNNEFVFLVQNNVGLRTYKSRNFMVKEHPQSLICFYESKITFGSLPENQ